ncbi:MAG: hypothetical protein AB1602_08370 [Elusimicrobiota bacterium]|nr:hypothetical protein [Elusimicrobiales bacterium]HPO95352.1 hypothetical protein [Elusimicrobiales bacterium]
MKIIIIVIGLFFSSNVFSDDNAVSKEVSINPTQSAVKTDTNEYITQSEFEKILKEAEDKLKMEKDKNKRLRDYVFELINIKREMYPHERVKAGLALEEMKEKYPDMAIKIFSKEIEMNGGNKDAYFERGELYTRMCYSRNDKSICEKAVSDLKEAIKNSKSDKDLDIWGIPFRMQVYDRLGYIYETTVIKDLKLALSYYTKAIKSDTFQPSAEYFERARVYRIIKEYDKAIEDLKQYKKCTTNSNSDKERKVYGLCYDLYRQSGREFIKECPTKEEIEKKLNVKFKEEVK